MSSVKHTTPMTQNLHDCSGVIHLQTTTHLLSLWRQSDRKKPTSPKETRKSNRRGSRRQGGSGSHWSSEQSAAGAGINGGAIDQSRMRVGWIGEMHQVENGGQRTAGPRLKVSASLQSSRILVLVLVGTCAGVGVGFDRACTLYRTVW